MPKYLRARAQFYPMFAFATIAALLAGGVLAAVTPASSAHAATPSALAGNSGFTVVTEGDAILNSQSETEGSWAVGGNLTQQGSKYTLLAGAYQPTAALPVVETRATRLLVGGSVTLVPGSGQERLNVNPADGYGNVTIGAASPAYSVTTSGEIRDASGAYIKTGSPAAAVNPYPTSSTAFASVIPSSAFASYRSLSNSLLSLAGAATPTITLGPLNGSPLSASDTGVTLVAGKVNVWNPTVTEWNKIQNGVIKFYNGSPADASTPLVINVPASASSLSSPEFSGVSADIAKYVLWNVQSTSTFTLDGSKLMSGAVLAPNANLVFNKSTPAEGQYVAKTASATGNAEIYHIAFIPELVPPTTPKDKYEVAIYLYKLKDPKKPASWSNSLKQTFIASKTGTEWFTTFPGDLPLDVCGDGWGIQQDKVKNWSYGGGFAWPTNITYPNDNIGWPPIYDAKHTTLDTLITVPACESPTGEPTLEVATCEPTTRNWASLPAVTGGQWTIEKDGTTTTVPSFDGAPASGYGTYTITLVDADANDRYTVAAASFTWAPVDRATLPCAFASDPVFVKQKCNPTGPGATDASYEVVEAGGVRYELSVNDGPLGAIDPDVYPITAFPTKIRIVAFAEPGYTLVGTSDQSFVFESAGDCIDNDASATIATTPPTCTTASGIDLAKSTLVNATFTTSPMPSGAGSYSVVATAASGHAFPGGLPTLTIPVTLEAAGTGLDCPKPPPVTPPTPPVLASTGEGVPVGMGLAGALLVLAGIGFAIARRRMIS